MLIDSVKQLDISKVNFLLENMPPYGWFYKSVEKAEKIIQTLKKAKIYDVILFQEAFSFNIRDMIHDSLKNIYPNQININDKTIFYKMNSGLWAISSIPIKLIDNIILP